MTRTSNTPQAKHLGQKSVARVETNGPTDTTDRITLPANAFDNDIDDNGSKYVLTSCSGAGNLLSRCRWLC